MKNHEYSALLVIASLLSVGAMLLRDAGDRPGLEAPTAPKEVAPVHEDLAQPKGAAGRRALEATGTVEARVAQETRPAEALPLPAAPGCRRQELRVEIESPAEFPDGSRSQVKVVIESELSEDVLIAVAVELSPGIEFAAKVLTRADFGARELVQLDVAHDEAGPSRVLFEDYIRADSELTYEFELVFLGRQGQSEEISARAMRLFPDGRPDHRVAGADFEQYESDGVPVRMKRSAARSGASEEQDLALGAAPERFVELPATDPFASPPLARDRGRFTVGETLKRDRNEIPTPAIRYQR